MTAFSDLLENLLLDHSLRNVSWTSPTTVFIALHTADPTDVETTASANEVAASGYDRFEVSAGLGGFTTASGGSCRNSEAWEFLTATTAWGSISHMSIWDNTTTGLMMYHGALTTTKVVGTDDIVRFPANTLSVKLD